MALGHVINSHFQLSFKKVPFEFFLRQNARAKSLLTLKPLHFDEKFLKVNSKHKQSRISIFLVKMKLGLNSYPLECNFKIGRWA